MQLRAAIMVRSYKCRGIGKGPFSATNFARAVVTAAHFQESGREPGAKVRLERRPGTRNWQLGTQSTAESLDGVLRTGHRVS